MREYITFVVWLKLGEFLLRSVEPISDSGRDMPLPLVGEAVGVLLMRNGDTCSNCHEHRAHSGQGQKMLTPSLRDIAASRRGPARAGAGLARNAGEEWRSRWGSEV